MTTASPVLRPAPPSIATSAPSSDEAVCRRDHAAILAALGKLGGQRIGHLYGSFEKHLLAVYRILGEWKAPEPVRLAGLFHAAYSTHGFADAILQLGDRRWLAELIGTEAEEHAYLFCAVNREETWPQIGRNDPIVFNDRFTCLRHGISDQQIRAHCEILAANHVDFARSDPLRPDEQLSRITALLDQISPFLSNAAIECYRSEVARPAPLP